MDKGESVGENSGASDGVAKASSFEGCEPLDAYRREAIKLVLGTLASTVDLVYNKDFDEIVGGLWGSLVKLENCHC